MVLCLKTFLRVLALHMVSHEGSNERPVNVNWDSNLLAPTCVILRRRFPRTWPSASLISLLSEPVVSCSEICVRRPKVMNQGVSQIRFGTYYDHEDVMEIGYWPNLCAREVNDRLEESDRVPREIDPVPFPPPRLQEQYPAFSFSK